MPVGALSHYGYAEESLAAQGTLVAITKFFDPTAADIDDSYPREAIATLREDRVRARSVTKIVEVKGSWTSPLFYNALPFFFKMALGSCTTTSAGTAYQHTFTGAKKLKTFSTEVSYYTPTVTAKQAAGCKVDKLSISAKSGEVVEASCDFIGMKTSKNAQATATLPSDDNVAVYSHATLTLDAVSNLDLMSMELSIENNLEMVNTFNGTVFTTRVNDGVRNITCSMEMDFLTQAMYDLAVAGTKKAVVFSCISPVVAGGGSNYYKAVFTMPNVKFANVATPIEADGVISQKVDAVVMYDSGTSKDIDIVVVNTDVSYPDVP